MSGDLRAQRSSRDALQSMLATLLHLDLSDQVVCDGPILKAHGGFCDVFQGRWVLQGVCIYKVAIKRLRVHIQGDRDFAKYLAKEIRIWSKLAHRNVLPLLGYIIEGDYPSLVSEWMENGTVSRYMRLHPETDLLQMILGIAHGLQYLHDEGVVHSDIKADNVLVSSSGVPRICDFGISKLLAASQSYSDTSTHTGVRGSVRWMAPELLAIHPEAQAKHSMKSDVWAFGMTIYELLTNRVPYSYLKRDVQVMFSIMEGITPVCPVEYFTWPVYWQKLWSICVVSWSQWPEQRKPISDIVSYLEFLCRCAEEEKYRSRGIPQDEIFHEFEEQRRSFHHQASILGEDEPRLLTEEPRLPHVSYEFNYESSDEQPLNYDVEDPSSDTPTRSVSNGIAQRADNLRTPHRRAPSLGHQDVIRDFDLRGASPVENRTDTKIPQHEEPFDLIKKWKESLRLPSTASRDTSFQEEPARYYSGFLSPQDADKFASGLSRSSVASSLGSSTIVNNTEVYAGPAEMDSPGTFREETMQEVTLPEPRLGPPDSAGPPKPRTLRRRAGTVSRIRL